MTSARKTGSAPQQERARQRVDAILAAAATALRTESVEALSMSRVAAEAGASLPTVYRYFPDRSALVRALAERYLEQLHAGIAERLTGLRTYAQARAAVRDVTLGYFAAFRDDAALRQLWAGTLADPVLAELNVADSKRNGALLADRLGPFTALDDETLLRRCILLCHLALSTVSLAISLAADEGAAFVEEFEGFADALLPPAAPSVAVRHPRRAGRAATGQT